MSLPTDTTINVNYTVDQGNHILNLSGSASPEIYQTILQSLTYVNIQSEPRPEVRLIEIFVRDSVTQSQSLFLSVSLSLLNDNCPIISAKSSVLGFTEGSRTLSVGLESELLIKDEDFGSNSSILRVLIGISGVESIASEYLEINDTETLFFNRITGMYYLLYTCTFEYHMFVCFNISSQSYYRPYT